ncbi:hypothetical protein [Paenibacillus durus]|uniref:hypothetical protein n=1 Tax=Paenibacillus durus TaxID=44251 RepID=UPI000A717316|nr:hypothetical protein [Paenibacillus durus]
MKVKDIISFLQRMPQESEVWTGPYKGGKLERIIDATKEKDEDPTEDDSIVLWTT